MFLGGAGRWRDSGMAGTPPRHHPRFIDAQDDAVRALLAIIHDLRPHVVVTYDPTGGYGHPDHIHTHEITTTAVAAASTSDWPVPKFYWTVMATSAMETALNALTDIPEGWVRPNLGDIEFGYQDDEIDAVVDASEHLAAKAAALAAHTTQLTLAPDRRSCALSNNLALPILAEEHYILVNGDPGERDDRGWETDLLAGLNLG
jgi:N-acetyl-1-D-myo-inositol-2-amino-2-deoxy-alpha-D-glucopyranoside deacetylase